MIFEKNFMSQYSAYTDSELLNAIKENDKVALAELYDRYWRPLLHHALNSLHSQDFAEEVVQDLFIKIWNLRETLNILNIRYYLHSSVRNGCISFLRSQLAEEKKWDEYKLYLPKEQASVETVYLNQEKTELLEKVIHKLPVKTQQIFRLKMIDGLTFRDISAQLNCSEKTILYHLSKSKRLLKSELQNMLFLAVAFFNAL